MDCYSKDKTASCKLYQNSFYDFSTNTGGDCILFAARVLNVNSWNVCQYLIQAFSLPISLSGYADNRAKIKRRKKEQQEQQEKERLFWKAWRHQVEALKNWQRVYQTVLKSGKIKPFSGLEAYIINKAQITDYKLDILCAGDSRSEQEKFLRTEGWRIH